MLIAYYVSNVIYTWEMYRKKFFIQLWKNKFFIPFSFHSVFLYLSIVAVVIIIILTIYCLFFNIFFLFLSLWFVYFVRKTCVKYKLYSEYLLLASSVSPKLKAHNPFGCFFFTSMILTNENGHQHWQMLVNSYSSSLLRNEQQKTKKFFL